MVRLRHEGVKVKFSLLRGLGRGIEHGVARTPPHVCVALLRLLAFADAVHLRAADWAGPLSGRLTIFHGHLFRVLHLSLCPALQAIRFHSGCSFLSSRCGCPSPLCLGGLSTVLDLRRRRCRPFWQPASVSGCRYVGSYDIPFCVEVK